MYHVYFGYFRALSSLMNTDQMFYAGQMEILQLCLNVIFDEVDGLSKVLLECMLADGQWHVCLFLAAG